MNLTNDDVRDILNLLDCLPYDELRLKTARFTLTLRRTAGGTWTQETEVLSPPHAVDAASGRPVAAAPTDGSNFSMITDKGDAGADAGSAAHPKGVGQRGLGEVRAPLLGTFYRAPRPGAPPFVEVGSRVDEETVVGIIETMKLMNPVHAETRGTVAEICLADAQFAEQDVVLMRVQPET